MNVHPDDIAAIRAALVAEGADATDSPVHASWRCFDKDRYPEPCNCMDAAAYEIALAVLPAHDQRLRDNLADGLIAAFPQTFRGEDGHLSARMYSSGEYAEWLRAGNGDNDE